MSKADFWSELEQRLDENKQLSDGGIPAVFRPLASFLGLYPWQSLLIVSLGLVLTLMFVAKSQVITLTEKFLLIW